MSFPIYSPYSPASLGSEGSPYLCIWDTVGKYSYTSWVHRTAHEQSFVNRCLFADGWSWTRVCQRANFVCLCVFICLQIADCSWNPPHPRCHSPELLPMAHSHGGTSLSCHRARANYKRLLGARAPPEERASGQSDQPSPGLIIWFPVRPVQAELLDPRVWVG